MLAGHQITYTPTRCAQCGRELHSAKDWSECRSQHTQEYWAAQPGGALILEWCKDLVQSRQQTS